MEDIGKELEKVFSKGNYKQTYDAIVIEIMQDPDVKKFILENNDKINDKIIQNSFSKLYEFFIEKEKNQFNGYEPILFLNRNFIDVEYRPTEEFLLKQREQEKNNRIKAIEMPKDIKSASLSDFQIINEKDDRSQAFEESLQFIQSYTKNPSEYNKGLYLYGSFGVGKTYLLGAIANTLAKKGTNVTLAHFPSFVVAIKQSISDNTLTEKLNKIKQSEILMLDDIGADSMSAWIRDEVLGVILQYRMQEQLPTFFSSNFNMTQLEEDYLRISNKGDDEPLKAKRIMERIKYLSKEVPMIGINRRNS